MELSESLLTTAVVLGAFTTFLSGVEELLQHVGSRGNSERWQWLRASA